MITTHGIKYQPFIGFQYIAYMLVLIHGKLQAVLVELHAGAGAFAIK